MTVSVTIESQAMWSQAIKTLRDRVIADATPMKYVVFVEVMKEIEKIGSVQQFIGFETIKEESI